LKVLQESQRGKYVFVAKAKDGQLVAQKQYVETGMNYNNQVEIKSGLSAKDRILVRGYQDVANGQPISQPQAAAE
jgi:multidrug efflux pump subunit AcrA (membrane-fusion protein)